MFRRLRFHVAVQNFKVSSDCCNCGIIVDNPPDVSLSLLIGKTKGTFLMQMLNQVLFMISPTMKVDLLTVKIIKIKMRDYVVECFAQARNVLIVCFSFILSCLRLLQNYPD